MSFPYTVTWSTMASRCTVILRIDHFEYNEAMIGSGKKRLEYRDVRGVFREPSTLHIVVRDRDYPVQYKSGDHSFDGFVERLLERVKHAYGYV